MPNVAIKIVIDRSHTTVVYWLTISRQKSFDRLVLIFLLGFDNNMKKSTKNCKGIAQTN